jgi:hypothetical protein
MSKSTDHQARLARLARADAATDTDRRARLARAEADLSEPRAQPRRAHFSGTLAAGVATFGAGRDDPAGFRADLPVVLALSGNSRQPETPEQAKHRSRWAAWRPHG